MWPQRLGKRTHQLLRKVAGGRQSVATGDCTLLLEFREIGGGGLFLSVCADQQRFAFWVDEAEWCTWISPVLTVPGWDKVPETLFSALTAWTLAPAHSFFESANLTFPEGEAISPGRIETDFGWVLTLIHEERRLALRCIDAPFDWLDSLANVLVPKEDAEEGLTSEASFPFYLVAGWVQISYQELLHLQVGDGVTLQNISDISAGQAWLFQDRPLAKLELQEEGTCQVSEAAIPSFDDWLDVTPVAATPEAFGDTLLTVVAQIGTIELPLSAVAKMAPGQVFEAPAHYDGSVKLTVNGRTLGYGMLLEIDGCLVVRVERIGG